jgi:hypothetical protein
MLKRFTLWINGRRLSGSFDTREQAVSHRDSIASFHEGMIEIRDSNDKAAEAVRLLNLYRHW